MVPIGILLGIYTIGEIAVLLFLVGWGRTMIIVMAGSLVLDALTVVTVYNNEHRELEILRRLTDAARELAIGGTELNVGPPPPDDTKDEVDILRGVLIQHAHARNMLINQIKRVADGDYSVDITPRGHKDEVISAFSVMARHLRFMLDRLNAINDQLVRLGVESVLEPRREYVVRELIDEALAEARESVDEIMLDLDVSFSDEVPERLYGDYGQMKRIFSTLMSMIFERAKGGHLSWRISGERISSTFWFVSAMQFEGTGLEYKNAEKAFAGDSAYLYDVEMSDNYEVFKLTMLRRLTEMLDGTIGVTRFAANRATITISLRQLLP
jgi:hypothetical protein